MMVGQNLCVMSENAFRQGFKRRAELQEKLEQQQNYGIKMIGLSGMVLTVIGFVTSRGFRNLRTLSTAIESRTANQSSELSQLQQRLFNQLEHEKTWSLKNYALNVLCTVDNMERALKHPYDKKGVTMIGKELLNTIKTYSNK